MKAASVALFALEIAWGAARASAEPEVPRGLVREFKGAFFTDMQHGYVFGNAAPTTVIATQDGGTSWRLVLDVSEGGLEEDIEAIFFLDADHFWVLHRSGTLRRTSDGGRSITVSSPHFVDQQSGKTEPLTCGGGPFFRAATQGWMTCQQNVLKTVDGGRTWTPKLVPLSVGGPEGIWMFDDREGTTVGGRVLHTTDGGAIWTAVPNSPNFDQVSCTRNSFCAGWVALQGPLLVTRDRGLTWQDTHIPLLADGRDRINQIQAVSSNLVLVVGSDVGFTDTELAKYIGTGIPAPAFIARGLLVKWDGSTWTRTTFAAPTHFAGLFFLDGDNGWLPAYENAIYKTTDGGQTLQFVPDYFRQIAALTPTEPLLSPDPTPAPPTP